jgi:hypothetical protein
MTVTEWKKRLDVWTELVDAIRSLTGMDHDTADLEAKRIAFELPDAAKHDSDSINVQYLSGFDENLFPSYGQITLVKKPSDHGIKWTLPSNGIDIQYEVVEPLKLKP